MSDETEAKDRADWIANNATRLSGEPGFAKMVRRGSVYSAVERERIAQGRFIPAKAELEKAYTDAFRAVALHKGWNGEEIFVTLERESVSGNWFTYLRVHDLRQEFHSNNDLWKEMKKSLQGVIPEWEPGLNFEKVKDSRFNIAIPHANTETVLGAVNDYIRSVNRDSAVDWQKITAPALAQLEAYKTVTAPGLASH